MYPGSFYLLTLAALHDVLEDTYYTEEDLLSDFNELTLDIIKSLTKKKGEELEGYFTRIDNCMSPELAWTVKLADRIHNVKSLRLIFNTKIEKVRRYVEETETQYIPKALLVDESMAQDLIHELNSIKDEIKDT